MYDGASVGVVVPTHNEADFVTDVVGTIPTFVDRIIVVDDCSTDETWPEIQAFLAAQRAELETADSTETQVGLADGSGLPGAVPEVSTEGRVVSVRHATNRGRGAAVKTGYRIALQAGLDLVAVMDGDGQMDPEILDRIVEPVAAGRADYAKGNRLLEPDHHAEMPRFRYVGNVVLTHLTRLASGYWGVGDPQNGYTAISAAMLRELSIDRLYDRYGFLNDLLVRLGAHDARVVDVPMRAVYGEESSGIRYRSFVPRLSVLLLRGFLWRLSTTCGGER